ncbi:MAG: alpha/beta hydrolase-fold protein [Wenzhouxiangellaceae bacterium]|nr:alpha/beta hydrolase-fold protein [Wenzhouxiangellaceae bacterium]
MDSGILTNARINPLLRPAGPEQRGRVEIFSFRSAILQAENPLNDPFERSISIYLPPNYDVDSSRRYPVLWSLAAYTSSGQAQIAWRNHGENLPQRLDRLIDAGKLAPVVCVMPDSYTSLGGNQFVDSPALGRYASHLVDELLPEVDRRYRTIAESAGRGVFGKSSGGFGALHLASRFPGVFAGVASHAGDCGFDRVYLRDFPACCDELALHDGKLDKFVQSFWSARKPSGRAFHTLMVLCLAASYSPSPGAPLDLELPFDLETARLRPEVWRRWKTFDPVEYRPLQIEALAALRGLWIDAGNRDQYFIHYGTRELHKRLSEAAVDHHYEEFDGNHSGMDWRLDFSLPWLVSRLKQD